MLNKRLFKIGITYSIGVITGLAIAPYSHLEPHRATIKPKPAYTIAQLKSYTQMAYGKSDIKFECLDLLWTMESDWNYKSLGFMTTQGRALGIAQALPAKRMKSVGKDYKINPITQIKWGLLYVKDRYNNDACRALRHEFNYGWY